MPTVPYRAHNCTVGKICHYFLMRIGERSLLELSKKSGCARIKVSLRHGGVCFSFVAEKSLDVSTIFLKQGVRAVFRMSLEVYE